MHKFSVILPVRNGGAYIKECVSSILAQTFQDFNLIILDNNSTDGTVDWLNSLNSEKIIIHPSGESLSIEANWARITTVAKNEFITLIGHDDVLYPDFLENINKLITAYPEAGLYHTHFHFINAKGSVIRQSKGMSTFYSFNDLLKSFLTQAVDSMGTGYVMRSKDYDSINGIPVRYPSLLFADFELWLRLSKKGGMAVHNNYSFAFRVHQSTTGKSEDSRLHSALNLYTDYLIELKKDNAAVASVIDKYAAEMLLFYCSGFAHRLLRTPMEKRNNLTVAAFINNTKAMAVKLGVENNYEPENSFSVFMARLIDSNSVTRMLFLLFKKIYGKPVL
jgi:glycosyltransferase involved in cell wall biosynthesis